MESPKTPEQLVDQLEEILNQRISDLDDPFENTYSVDEVLLLAQRAIRNFRRYQ